MINYIRFNSARKNKYSLITIEKTYKGKEYFVKKAATKEAVDFLESLLYKYEIIKKIQNNPFIPVKPIKYKDGIYFPKIEGYSWRLQIEELVKKHLYNEAIKEIYKLKTSLDSIAIEDINIEDYNYDTNLISKDLLQNETKWLNVGSIDIIFDNIIIDDDKKYLIDYEWTFDFPVPFNYVFFRSLYGLLYMLRIVSGLNIQAIREEFKDFLKEKYFKAEYSFRKEVYKSIESYEQYKKDVEYVLYAPYRKNTFIQDLDLQNQNLQSKIKELENRIQHLDEEINKKEADIVELNYQIVELKNIKNNLQAILNRKSVKATLWLMSKLSILFFYLRRFRNLLSKLKK